MSQHTPFVTRPLRACYALSPCRYLRYAVTRPCAYAHVRACASPATAAIVASLPLVSVLGMIFLWQARPDAENMAVHSAATFWYVLPSLPMFLLIPVLLRRGVPFWPALGAGCLALWGWRGYQHWKRRQAADR